MYVPEAFGETRLPVLYDAIDACGLAIFITTAPDGPLATHVPMLLARDEGPFGTLHFHLARANPHWQSAANTPALVIWPGPNGYVSPEWYAAKAEHGRVVPTWNYITVHATGIAETYTGAADLSALVARVTDRHEAGRVRPWTVDDAPPPFVAEQLSAIIGVRMPINGLQGKWKLSQNRAPKDRAGLLDGYAAEADPTYTALAAASRAVFPAA
jgi:transcriptional regulator